MRKTVKDWINSIVDIELRKKCLYNQQEHHLVVEVNSLPEAIMGLSWRASYTTSFWTNLYRDVLSKEIPTMEDQKFTPGEYVIATGNVYKNILTNRIAKYVKTYEYSQNAHMVDFSINTDCPHYKTIIAESIRRATQQEIDDFLKSIEKKQPDVVDTKGWSIGDKIPKEFTKNLEIIDYTRPSWKKSNGWSNDITIRCFDRTLSENSVGIYESNDYRIRLGSLPHKNEVYKKEQDIPLSGIKIGTLLRIKNTGCACTGHGDLPIVSKDQVYTVTKNLTNTLYKGVNWDTSHNITLLLDDEYVIGINESNKDTFVEIVTEPKKDTSAHLTIIDVSPEKEKHTYPDYKPGQRVKVHDGFNIDKENYPINTGVIREIDKNYSHQPCLRIDLDDGKKATCYPFGLRGFNVEILSESESKPSFYRPGDWIFIKDDQFKIDVVTDNYITTTSGVEYSLKNPEFIVLKTGAENPKFKVGAKYTFNGNTFTVTGFSCESNGWYITRDSGSPFRIGSSGIYLRSLPSSKFKIGYVVTARSIKNSASCSIDEPKDNWITAKANVGIESSIQEVAWSKSRNTWCYRLNKNGNWYVEEAIEFWKPIKSIEYYKQFIGRIIQLTPQFMSRIDPELTGGISIYQIKDVLPISGNLFYQLCDTQLVVSVHDDINSECFLLDLPKTLTKDPTKLLILDSPTQKKAEDFKEKASLEPNNSIIVNSVKNKRPITFPVDEEKDSSIIVMGKKKPMMLSNQTEVENTKIIFIKN